MVTYDFDFGGDLFTMTSIPGVTPILSEHIRGQQQGRVNGNEPPMMNIPRVDITFWLYYPPNCHTPC